MAAWIGPQWQEPRGGLVDSGEDAHHRRLLAEFMLGPFVASNAGHHLHHQLDGQPLPTTLNLLPGAVSGCSDLRNDVNGTHIELEADVQLPPGWEKCLNLKDGSIYYLNRTTGAMSAAEPHKQASIDKLRSGADPSASPTTSELTVEAPNDAISSSKTYPIHKSPTVSETARANPNSDAAETGWLDLNLTLQVGGCPSLKATPSRDANASILRPVTLTSANPKAPTEVRAPALSSPTTSSATYPSFNASLAFSQAILSSKELSQHSFLRPNSFREEESSRTTNRPAGCRSFYDEDQKPLCIYDSQAASEVTQKRAGSDNLLMASSGAMVTVPCANCLMFVMLSKGNPKCPRCGCNCPEQIDFPGPPLKKAKLGFSF